jgi:hypothetical protein
LLLASCTQPINPVSYHLTYHPNTADSGSVPLDNRTYQSGTAALVASNSGSLVKAGHVFTGWNTAVDGSGYFYTPGSALALVDADVTLYAWWQAEGSASLYTVRYDGNGHTGGDEPAAVSYPQYAAVVPPSSAGSMVKSGHVLGGWMDTPDGTGTTYALGTPLAMGTKDITLHAIWIPEEYLFEGYGHTLTLVRLQRSLGPSISIPAGVTALGRTTAKQISTGFFESIFSGYVNITEVYIPSSVVYIGPWVFYGCTNLADINLPNAITEISANAFRDCTSLVSIDLPGSVNHLSWNAFGGCTNLTSITLPAGVTRIDLSVFSGCTSLAEIICLPLVPPTLGTNVFNNLPAGYQIKVSAASVEAYKAASGWSSVAANIVAIE